MDQQKAVAQLHADLGLKRLNRGWVKLVWILAGLTCIFLLNFCYGVTASYGSVTDPATSWSAVTDQVIDRFWFALFVPNAVVRDGKLYLLTQVTRPSTFVVTFVSRGEWDADKLQQFRRSHPKLEEYWPDKMRADGGVTWLPR